MPRQGLNKEAVTDAAVKLIEEKSIAAFSMNELARTLNIKAASLYTHVESMDALLTDIGLSAVSKMVENEKSAIADKTQDDALFALAAAYRQYAKEHYELYLLVMNIPRQHNPVLEQAAEEITDPIMSVLAGYGISRDDQMHYQRILRAMLHGFVAHEECGAFSHFPVDKDESFTKAIRAIADSLHSIGGEEK